MARDPNEMTDLMRGVTQDTALRRHGHDVLFLERDQPWYAEHRDLPDPDFCTGPQYPAAIDWPANVERIEHPGPADHAAFYSALGWTLNVTRADMVRAGWSPSVRLFEASACGVPIISDE